MNPTESESPETIKTQKKITKIETESQQETTEEVEHIVTEVVMVPEHSLNSPQFKMSMPSTNRDSMRRSSMSLPMQASMLEREINDLRLSVKMKDREVQDKHEEFKDLKNTLALAEEKNSKLETEHRRMVKLLKDEAQKYKEFYHKKFDNVKSGVEDLRVIFYSVSHLFADFKLETESALKTLR